MAVACLSVRRSASLLAGLAFVAGALPAAAQIPPVANQGTEEGAPWFVGASQGFVHDSNVSRVPGGEGDTRSLTSLFGGFDARLGRQRLYGRAAAGVSRYFDEDGYDNTAYDLRSGIDWETVGRLSGNVEAGIGSRLSRPAISDAEPDPERNMERTQRIVARARLGGQGLLSIEGSVGHARVDQSGDAYASQESRSTGGGLGVYIHRGGPLRLGVAGRYERIRVPQALVDPVGGSVSEDRIRQRAIEVVAGYDDGSALAGQLRLGYARATHENPAFEGADFSGIAGRLDVGYRATGKLALQAYAAREPNLTPLQLSASSPSTEPTEPTPPPVIGDPATQVYQRNVVTNAVGLGAVYQATAKLGATVQYGYSRTRLVAVVADAAGNGREVLHRAGIGARYDYNRAVSFGCGYAYERTRVTGDTSYRYSVRTAGCDAAFVLR